MSLRSSFCFRASRPSGSQIRACAPRPSSGQGQSLRIRSRESLGRRVWEDVIVALITILPISAVTAITTSAPGPITKSADHSAALAVSVAATIAPSSKDGGLCCDSPARDGSPRPPVAGESQQQQRRGRQNPASKQPGSPLTGGALRTNQRNRPASSCGGGGAQGIAVTAKAQRQTQPPEQNQARQGRGNALGHARLASGDPELPTGSGFGRPGSAEARSVQRSTKIGRHWSQGCWQQGSGQGADQGQDQDQNQGIHARGHQHPLQIPQLDVGLGQGEGQAAAATVDAPAIAAQPSEPVDQILASSPSPFHQPFQPEEALAADPSLYHLFLLQNQNQLHQQQNLHYQQQQQQQQQHQDFVGDHGFAYLNHQYTCWSPPPPPHLSSFPPSSASAPPPETGLAPPPPTATPPRPPPRRRFQPTTSRRQQNLSHCRSNSSSNRRLLASRAPASHSASGKAPRQRLPPQDPPQPPTAHHRHSPFLPPPPHPPQPPSSSLSACSAASALSTSPSSSPVLASISSSPVVLSTLPSSSSSSSSLSACQTPHSVTSPHITMSRSSRNPPPTASGTGRQNEYFVPRDGIDREVISADICRYLGNDALVRPGHYENPQTGQVVQGYYITAYRNLTTAMIEDLKADSARWDSERRAQTSRNTSGGIIASRTAAGVPPRHSSNSPVVQYRYSETHQSRQHHGPTEGPYQTDPYSRDSAFDNPRYPGTGAPGYTGASGTYPPAYGSTSSGAYGGYPQSQQSPPPTDARYSSTPSAASTLNQAYQAAQDPYMAIGANRNQRGYASDPYANPMATSAAAAQQAVYATAAPTQAGYPASASPYQYSGQVPPAGASSYATMQPQDPFYGRGAYSNGIPVRQP
ncbi:hypothetical protein FDECE_15373 [Fusarium decemcellulare]|nr:hypothetical protein FDECE_15373 [Fusarium decemcellulare]